MSWSFRARAQRLRHLLGIEERQHLGIVRKNDGGGHRLAGHRRRRRCEHDGGDILQRAEAEQVVRIDRDVVAVVDRGCNRDLPERVPGVARLAGQLARRLLRRQPERVHDELSQRGLVRRDLDSGWRVQHCGGDGIGRGRRLGMGVTAGAHGVAGNVVAPPAEPGGTTSPDLSGRNPREGLHDRPHLDDGVGADDASHADARFTADGRAGTDFHGRGDEDHRAVSAERHAVRHNHRPAPNHRAVVDLGQIRIVEPSHVQDEAADVHRGGVRAEDERVEVPELRDEPDEWKRVEEPEAAVADRCREEAAHILRALPRPALDHRKAGLRMAPPHLPARRRREGEESAQPQAVEGR